MQRNGVRKGWGGAGIGFGLLAGLFLLAATGCIRMNSPDVVRRSYVLEVTRSGPVSPPATGLVLKVRTFQASARCPGKEFVYRKSDVLFDSDYYHGFLVMPGALIAGVVRDWLDASRGVGRVVDVSSRVPATHVLEGTVIRLEGDYRDPQKPQAVLALDLVLLSDRPTVPRVVWQKRYERTEGIAGASPAALVEGWNRALAGVLRDMESDVSAVNLAEGGRDASNGSGATCP